ncbi:MAG TPA: hypothetical protein VNM14_22550 [Planctomycetota bacterium]|nr:hypothetical protein [Planctomycetota bacterium]
MLAVETVMFAIQAGVKLYGALRKAYVDDTRDRSLILPLPRGNGVNEDSALNWFSGDPVGTRAAAKHPRIGQLLAAQTLSDDEKAELVEIYNVLFLEFVPQSGDQAGQRGQLSSDELGALLSVRQWAKGEAGASPSALQQVAGTIIGIAVDYFIATPNAVSQKHPQGRALYAFLKAIDSVDFANTPVNDIAGDLLIAVLDGVAAVPNLFSVGKNEQLLIENITKTLATSTKALLANAPTTEREDAGTWLNLIAKSLIKGGAETVLANPVRFLGVQEGAQAALVTQVGSVVTELVIGEDKVTFQRLLSGQGVESVVKSLLSALAKNPDLLRFENQGLKQLLLSLAEDLGKVEDLLSPDLFPELTRLILERSADNLDLLWSARSTSPSGHLLVLATKSVLKALSEKPPKGSTWKPSFTPEQILALAETVLDAVVDNPTWLENVPTAGAAPLSVVLSSVLAALRKRDPSVISAETGVSILRAAILASASRLSLLKMLPQTGKTAVEAALTMIFDIILGDTASAEAQWIFARNSALQALTALVLQQLAKVSVEQKHLQVLKQALEELMAGTLAPDLETFSITLGTRLMAA